MISTVPQLLMALGLAHLLNYKLRGSTFFRVAMLAPYATSVAAATLVFALLFGRDYGMINWVLRLRRHRPGRLAGRQVDLADRHLHRSSSGAGPATTR